MPNLKAKLYMLFVGATFMFAATTALHATTIESRQDCVMVVENTHASGDLIPILCLKAYHYDQVAIAIVPLQQNPLNAEVVTGSKTQKHFSRFERRRRQAGKSMWKHSTLNGYCPVRYHIRQC